MTRQREGEVELEEIYYFETPGLGYQRVYGTADRPIDVLAEVRTGDAVLIPHGWHGPSIAAPGYDLYYLNVMAGPAAGAQLALLRRPGARMDPPHVARPAGRSTSAADVRYR